jgi:Dynamin-like GTPase OPA1 C-terminal
MARAQDCRKAYYLYSQQGTECVINCSDVVLFWRIQQVIKVTANALRQQVINREARRLDKEIKEVLDEYSDDEDKKVTLLTGKRVILAEELSKYRLAYRVRFICSFFLVFYRVCSSRAPNSGKIGRVHKRSQHGEIEFCYA